MRRLFTASQARSAGVTPAALKWGEQSSRWRRVERGVYADGAAPVADLDRARARVLASGGVARGRLAGVLHGLDAVTLHGQSGRGRAIDEAETVVLGGARCAGGLDTLIDLAAMLSDDEWEQALESALRKGLTSVDALEAALPNLGRSRVRGCARIRRVLDLRPDGAPPTERGLFVELDGQQHADQPMYDARRETAVVASTGWLCGRFTWHEVVRVPTTTTRRLAELVGQARRRPVVRAAS